MAIAAEEQYANNLKVLQANPVMAGIVGQLFSFPLTNMRLVPSMIGDIYGEMFDMKSQQWVPLADPNDPMGEATRSIDQIWTPDCKVFTMIGLGLGYAAAAFAKKLLPYQRLVIWDYEATLFKAMLYAIDVHPLFSGKRIEVYVGNDILQRIEPWYLSLEAHEKLHMSFPITQSYTGTYLKDEYAAITQKCIDMLRFHAVGLSTWRTFGACIGDNDLENMPEYFLNPGYEHLKDLWKGRPAICVSAGPSLQKNLHQLLDNKVRASVGLISVGTTYGLLHGMGLEPDIVTTIDFQRLNWTDQFQYVPLDPECTLVYLHSTYPQTPRRWPGPKFVAENASDTVMWIRSLAEGKKSAAQVQTVSHLNLLVALELGANPIIMMGQDLSMTLDAHHAPGARSQDLAPGDAPPEAFCDAVDFAGKPVKTRHSFLSMLTVFERIIAEHPDTTFFNCSEQGLEIKGAKHIPLAEALALMTTQQQAYESDVLDTRPVFQGETPEALAYRMRPPLREVLKRTYHAYKPQIRETLIEDFTQVQRHVDELLHWAHDIQAIYDAAQRHREQGLTQAQEEAATASDALSLEDTLDDIVSERYYVPLLAMEKGLQERKTAWGLFGIRRFDFLVLMAEIPPPADQLRTGAQQRAYNAGRLYRAAKMIEEEAPVVQRLLHRVGRRLDAIIGTQGAWSARLAGLQFYREANMAIKKALDEAGMSGAAREDFQYFRQTQQYEAALALAESWGCFGGSVHKHVDRMTRHMTKYRADIRAALPKYLPQSAQVTTPHAQTSRNEDGVVWYG